MLKKSFFIVILTVLAMNLTIVQAQKNPSLNEYTQQTSGACAGFKTRVEAGDTARVIPNTSRNNLRSRASTSSQLLDQILPGEEFEIISDPQCANDITWWRVDYAGITGWIGEGTNEEYWIEPYWIEPYNNTNVSNNSQSRRNAPTVLSGILFTGGGGGSYSEACGDDYENFYGDNETTVVFQHQPVQNRNNIIIDSFPDIVYGMATNASSYMPAICSTEPLETAITISPDGAELPATIKNNNNKLSIQLPFIAYSQPGQWTLRFNDVTATIDVLRLDSPQILFDYDKVLLSGFAPNEDIVIIFHSTSGYEVFEVKVNQTGQYLGEIENTFSSLYLALSFKAAVGSQNHVIVHIGLGVAAGSYDKNLIFMDESEIKDFFYAIFWNDGKLGNTHCQGFLESQLSIGQNGRVIPGQANNVRTDADINAVSVGQVDGAEEFTTIYGPVCADDMAWWLVDAGNIVGWTSEGQGDKYWLEPYDN